MWLEAAAAFVLPQSGFIAEFGAIDPCGLDWAEIRFDRHSRMICSGRIDNTTSSRSDRLRLVLARRHTGVA
jgi:hypothetical protein